MNSCNIKEPANGLYLSKSDFIEFQDYLGKLIEHELGYNPILQCQNCNGCSRSTIVENITFVVTENCNLACTYCYEKHKTKNRMTKQIAKDAVDFILGSDKVNGYFSKDTTPGVTLEFIGGEPLLEIDLIDYIVDYFKLRAFELGHPWATNYMLSFTTNGTLYLSDKVQKFLKKNQGKVSMTITIDGNKELHDSCRVFPDGTGSYDIVEKAVKEWAKNECAPATKMTLAPANVMHTFEAHKNLWELGIIGAHTNCVYEEGWTIEHAKILYSEMKKLADYLIDNNLYKRYYTALFEESIGKQLTNMENWCGGNGKMLAIGTDGKVYPCIRFMKYSLSTPEREEKSIGDIYNGINIEDPWLKKLEMIDMKTQSPDKCLNCKISTGCSLCTAYHYDKFGDPNKRATYICEMHQARVMANCYYFNKLFKKLGVENHFDLNIPKELALEIIDEDEYNMLLSL